jgi:hypothetical protein
MKATSSSFASASSRASRCSRVSGANVVPPKSN